MSYVTAFGKHVRKPRLRRLKLEELYLHFSRRNDEPSDLGREQFKHHESTGRGPDHPDPFYLRLSDGKKWYDWLQIEMMNDYLHPQYWHGWEQLRVDWEGHHWKLKELFRWHRDPDLLPEWLKSAEWTPPKQE